MSLQSLLSIARSALITHQRAMAVTSQNVANAETPGYTRQRLEIQAADPEVGPFGTLGRGVTDLGVTRARVGFYDAAFRRDSGLLGGSSTLRSFLGQIESALNEPSGSGLGVALDEMFQSFADLANDPSSPAMRDLVRASAGRFVHLFHRLDGEVKQNQSDAITQMRNDVADVNELARKIADLNARVLASGGPNHSAPDLEDRRDLMIDQLSSLIAVRVTARDDGSISIAAGNTVLVDGGTSRALEVRMPAGGPVAIGLLGDIAEIDPVSGRLDAELDLVNTRIPAVQAQLDGMAASLVFEVNQIHRTGYNANGATNNDFFDPAGITAGTIDLSIFIQGSSANIAAGATPAIGDGNIALQISALADTGVGTLGGRTLRDYYNSIASSVGVDVRNIGQDADTYDALVGHDEAQRQSVSGVSVEEEMVNLIGQQQAYSAAARIVRVADEMMQDVLDIL
jgi:flagellar hook-associated protein 1 FlgK